MSSDSRSFFELIRRLPFSTHVFTGSFSSYSSLSSRVVASSQSTPTCDRRLLASPLVGFRVSFHAALMRHLTLATSIYMETIPRVASNRSPRTENYHLCPVSLVSHASHPPSAEESLISWLLFSCLPSSFGTTAEKAGQQGSVQYWPQRSIISIKSLCTCEDASVEAANFRSASGNRYLRVNTVL